MNEVSDTLPSIKEGRARRYYELVDAGDMSGLVMLFDRDAVYHRPGCEPVIGHAGLERFYREGRVIKEGRHTVSVLVLQGDDVAVQGSLAGRLRDGRAVDLRFADFFTFSEVNTFRRRDTFFTPMG
ncbi:nuclear transport factor 2 family protein [Streptomyces sp. NPDC001228]|uniref:nuclear transport factor 2 family protein n=1 Tax=Streptomyces sp. NPDC001228 TaxID=3154381 RepID=UPI0033231C76